MLSKLIAEQILPLIIENKTIESKMEEIKKEMKLKMLDDEKRRVYEKQGVVVKYTKHNKYEYNNQGIQEVLYNHGLLLKASTLKTDNGHILNQVNEFKEKQTYHIRINVKTTKEEFDYSKHSDTELVNEWYELNKQSNRLNALIRGAKKQMMNCEQLNKDLKMKFDGGSISLVKNKQTYDMEGIFNKFGLEFFFQNTTPVLGKIDEYIEQGLVEKKEIDNNKKLIDVGLKFMMMKLSDEEMVMNILYDKRYQTSLNKVG